MATKKVIPFPEPIAGEELPAYWERCKQLRALAGAGAEFVNNSEDITDKILGMTEVSYVP